MTTNRNEDHPMNHPENQQQTTSTGTTIAVEDRHGDRVVVCDNPASPDDLRHCEVGRIIDGGFQPAPFADWGLRSDALRIIADLVDVEVKR